MRIMVTGGAGFIGSHIVDHLLQNSNQVLVYDAFKYSNKSNLSEIEKLIKADKIKGSSLEVVEGNILDGKTLIKKMDGIDFVFHLAANADVRGGINNPEIDLSENVLGTHSVLMAMKKCHVKKIAFSSSATVYGEPEIFPTPENGINYQTSVYGASKLCGEAYIEAFCHYYQMKSYIFRFVSWIGERYSHGVIFDFVKKLIANSRDLEILGDGTQKKSYLYVKDGVRGIFNAISNFKETVNRFNLGNDQTIDVKSLAEIVIDEMNLKNVKFSFTGGERGWIGDSPLVHLDIKKIKRTGWYPETSQEDGIRMTVRYLLDHPEILRRN